MKIGHFFFKGRKKDDELQTNFCANFATGSWEPLTMLNPHFVAGEHRLFGGHKSEDIRNILI